MPPAAKQGHLKPDFDKYLNQKVNVYLQGGREVRGYDNVNNLVLDETVEYLRNTENEPTIRERKLGILVVRGVTIESFCGAMQEIENPYN